MAKKINESLAKLDSISVAALTYGILGIVAGLVVIFLNANPTSESTIWPLVGSLLFTLSLATSSLAALARLAYIAICANLEGLGGNISIDDYEE